MLLRPLLFAILLFTVNPAFLRAGFAQAIPRVFLVIEGNAGDAGSFGMDELARALAASGFDVVRSTRLADVKSDGLIIWAGIPSRAVRLHDLVYAGRISVPPDPESFTLRRLTVEKRQTLVIAGSDERGLMYGLLDLARQVRFRPGVSEASALLQSAAETTEKPATPVRGMIHFLHSSELEEEWYFDPEYWEAYLGMLARNRFNSFNLVFAHQTPYLAPPYPFLFGVEKYPQVQVPGLSAAAQQRNLEALRLISRMTRQRGMDFIMGIWQHRAWPDRQQSMVSGLSDAIIADYSRLAIEKLLRLCPEISGIQLRVNSESGIPAEQQTAFYRQVLAGIQATDHPVHLDLRGWGALPATIETAVDSRLPMRLSMKYWAEFMGMPYQAARMLPSYSYGDFLRYPRRFPVLYQLWTLGSHRLLPWGSVEWVKRFVSTTQLGEGIGFETCAPLSQKGFGNPPGKWRIFPERGREYYRWEFERYWLYYLLFGRLSYNPNAAEELWASEFRARFGEAALPIFDAFQASGRILPFLVSYRLSNLNMYVWPEKQAGGLLDFYIEVKPSDESRFETFEEYVLWRLQGVATAKMAPEEASRRLNQMAESTEKALTRASAVLDPAANKEYAANRIDLSVLALLARYHAQKILAGANLAVFYGSHDLWALTSARSHAAAGLAIWERLARMTDGVYFPGMVFGPQDVGHWKDNLTFVRHDVARLDEVREILQKYGVFDLGLDFGPPVAPRRASYEPPYGINYSIERRFHPLTPETVYNSQQGYGWLSSAGITASAPISLPYSSLEGDNLENLALPYQVLYRDYLRGTQKSTLQIDLPDGSYRVVSIVANQPELATGAFFIRARTGASLTSQATPQDLTYGLAETGDRILDVNVAGGRLALDFIPEERKDWLVSGLVVTRIGPRIAHVPVRNAAPGGRLQVVATLAVVPADPGRAPAPDASLHYFPPGGQRSVTVPMTLEPPGSPVSLASAGLTLDPRWDAGELRYWITARDGAGRETRLPRDRFFVLRVSRDSQAPRIEHTAPESCRPGTPLRLTFLIEDGAALAAARLHYRHLSQTRNFEVVNLTSAGLSYSAVIPGEYIDPAYDLIYYVEAVDVLGNGAFYPDPDHRTPYQVVKVQR